MCLCRGKGRIRQNTYDRDDLALDEGWKGHELQVQRQVELRMEAHGQLTIPLDSDSENMYESRAPGIETDTGVRDMERVKASRTEVTSRAIEMVCWARVILADYLSLAND